MTQEEKQLLLKDLSARLSYGVIVKENDGVMENDNKLLDIDMFDGCINYDYIIEDIKPYLRPMSSMTEEEKDNFNNLFNGTFQYFNQGVISASRLWDRNEAVFVGELDCSKLIDWLNEHHFDYRGLIERGLALEAPEGMYKNE